VPTESAIAQDAAHGRRAVVVPVDPEGIVVGVCTDEPEAEVVILKRHVALTVHVAAARAGRGPRIALHVPTRTTVPSPIRTGA